MEINKSLKMIRKERGLKQEQVAAMLDINRSTYTNFENGRRPDIDTLIRLADFYKISLDELVGRTNPEINPVSAFLKDDELSNDDISKNNWHLALSRRTVNNHLIFMTYILTLVKQDKLLKRTENYLLLIINYVIKNSLLLLQPKMEGKFETNVFGILSKDMLDFLWNITDMLEDAVNDEYRIPTNDSNFSNEELTDMETVHRFFSVNLNSILETSVKKNPVDE